MGIMTLMMHGKCIVLVRKLTLVESKFLDKSKFLDIFLNFLMVSSFTHMETGKVVLLGKKGASESRER